MQKKRKRDVKERKELRNRRSFKTEMQGDTTRDVKEGCEAERRQRKQASREVASFTNAEGSLWGRRCANCFTCSVSVKICVHVSCTGATFFCLRIAYILSPHGQFLLA